MKFCSLDTSFLCQEDIGTRFNDFIIKSMMVAVIDARAEMIYALLHSK